LSYYPFLREEKIRVINEAANENFKIIQAKDILDDCMKRYNLPEKFILYVGTLEPRKNIVRLLQAFSGVHEKTGVPLTIVGKKGWKYKEIFNTFLDLNLEEKVLFTGYVEPEELPALYNLATLFVYPSLYEGFGLPPLEAMQCGCPVVTSSVSSLPEVVGDAAIKVNPRSIQEIEQAMCRLLSDENLRNNYIEQGVKQAEKFSWERCARETYQVYQEVWNED
jgi:glycosyltransferase involved in cell wall biosynthesis